MRSARKMAVVVGILALGVPAPARTQAQVLTGYYRWAPGYYSGGYYYAAPGYYLVPQTYAYARPTYASYYAPTYARPARGIGASSSYIDADGVERDPRYPHWSFDPREQRDHNP